jgi:hypothetical protein
MKTNELTGKALNWAVGKAEGLDGWLAPVNYCGKWEHGGPIIERERIGIDCDDQGVWFASFDLSAETALGASALTPLVAAMRCYVASQLGDDVDVPKDLV